MLSFMWFLLVLYNFGKNNVIKCGLFYLNIISCVFNNFSFKEVRIMKNVLK